MVNFYKVLLFSSIFSSISLTFEQEVDLQLKTILPTDLVGLITKYANTDFENEYNRLRNAALLPIKEKEIIQKFLSETRVLRHKLIEKIGTEDNSLLDEIIKLEAELVLRKWGGYEVDGWFIIETIRLDANFSTKELLEKFQYFVSNQIKFEFFQEETVRCRCKRLAYYLIIKYGQNSQDLNELIEIMVKISKIQREESDIDLIKRNIRNNLFKAALITI